jgi:hypothetical protein
MSSSAPSRAVRRSLSACTLLALLLVGGAAQPASAQDSHYWAEQYGTRAALLGGAVIGSVADLSGVYYNPGAIALNPDAGFILSARAYRVGTITIEDAAGDGRDLSSSATRPIATLLATPLTFGFLGSHRLVYSVLTRQQFATDILAYRIDQADYLPPPGDEDFAGAYTGSARLRETWTGLTWAFPLSEKVGIGISPYLALRSRELRSQFLVQAATEGGDVGSAIRIRTRRFKHWRLVNKIGLSYQSERFSLGVNTTTPSISLSGSGLASYNSSGTSSDLTSGFIDEPYLAANVQPELSSTFKSGWIVGGGTGVLLGATRLHASAEWFQAPSTFVALEADDFTPQTGGDPIQNDININLKSVFNWGVGVEQPLGGAMLYAAVATDRSAGVPDVDVLTDAVLTKYDLTRISGGASFRLGRADLMLGVGYAGGSSPFPKLFDQDEIDPEVDPTLDTRILLSQWTFVIGVELLRRDDDEGN